MEGIPGQQSKEDELSLLVVDDAASSPDIISKLLRQTLIVQGTLLNSWPQTYILRKHTTRKNQEIQKCKPSAIPVYVTKICDHITTRRSKYNIIKGERQRTRNKRYFFVIIYLYLHDSDSSLVDKQNLHLAHIAS
jgi:hypothetical protein